MRTRSKILTGTALALVMLAGQAPAAQSAIANTLLSPESDGASFMIAQAEEGLSEEELRRRAEEEARRAREDAEGQQPAEEVPAPAEEAPPPPPAEETPAPVEEAPAPGEEAPPPAPEAPQPADEAPPPAPVEEPAAPPPPEEEPPAEAPPVEEPASPAPAEEPAAPTQESAPEQAIPPYEEAPTPTPSPEAESEQPAGEQEAAPAETPQDAPTPTDAPEAPTPPTGEAPTPAPAPEEPAAPEDEAPTPPVQEAPTDAAPAEPVEPAAPAEQQPAQPAPQTETAPAEGQPPVTEGASEAIGDQAPLLDSAKEAPAPEQAPDGGQAPQAAQPAPAPATPAGPPPATDVEAQQLEQPVEFRSLRSEEGRRIENYEGRRERWEGVEPVRELGDRTILQFNNQTFVRSDDRGRIGRDAEEVYYEELPRGRYRETVVRRNGVQVVTVYDRYGDVVERSRFSPDGREYVLVYSDGGRRDRDERRAWRDPGRDLPPLRLTIPANEYILDAGTVQDDDIYYEFLEQPPVEPVRRLYSVDEVRYSARVRDSVRRVELDTINFEFGSPNISEDAVPRLEGVANAINRLLEDNPGEVFLIEGHTDAVGSDEANLALSDRRAEGVVTALTNVFGIPPENLVTQGYGENYLKVNTESPERENRRVAIRRITPLVAPVASAR